MKKITSLLIIIGLLIAWCGVGQVQAEPAMPFAADYSSSPIFTVATAPPLVMLVMGRDHKLYYAAYNDASDLNGDGIINVGYDPNIDYYGYFDSYKCYTYSSSNNRFEPHSVTSDKTCSSRWSGDFLNYVTMSRMDTMRKVLYGGYRSTDTATETVLERAFIPQDAHSWGKEYESIQRDGYDIRDYTPLSLPAPDTRHLFANTTLSNTGPPLMRVLTDSIYRIWEWVAVERPVAGDYCLDGRPPPHGVPCATSGGEFWEIVPPDAFTELTQTTYDTWVDLPGTPPGSPLNHADFNALESDFGIEARKDGSGPVANIDGSGNPFGADNHYMTIFEGKINVPADGTYEFAVDGDDAVELMINGTVVAYYYGAHPICECQHHSGTINLTTGQHDLVFRHEEGTGQDSYHLYWKRTIPSSQRTDYHVRVQVGVASMPEPNCKQYGGATGPYKPVGLLQKHGETDKMYFGLMTGSYAKNTSGGVLRKNIGSIKDEIDPDTGQFTNVNGIIQTINKFRIVDFRYSDYSYQPGWDGAWVTTRPMNEGEFPDWGNPIGEMMYETLRYFADGETATPDYNYSGTSRDATLGLSQPAWSDPFLQPDGGGNDLDLYCAKPIMLVISDINPSYDSDQLPGSAFAAGGWSGGRALGAGTLHVQDRLNQISGDVAGTHFIGQVGSDYDSSCAPKTVAGLGNVRGLCPEEPTKQGSYYAGAIAHYGRNTDLRPDLPGAQQVSTYSVALSSPLPEIVIPVDGQTVTLVPFGKSVGGCLGITPTGPFQPTNTIVHFFVESLTPTSGTFRINFEDVEQAADHDMDAIVFYSYQVVDDHDNPVSDPSQGTRVSITLQSEYAAGCIIQHMGYIISGTTEDGTYLEVRDHDTSASNDVNYFLDTPPPGYRDGGTNGLPLTATRVFTPSSASAATLLKDPLWYAAKWGGDAEGREWDKAGDGVPDTYFYVINPLLLEQQLNRAFASILEKASSGTSASVLATTSRGEGNVLQAFFRPTIPEDDQIKWLGYLRNLWVDSMGNIRENTSGANADTSYSLNVYEDKILVFESTETGDTIVRRYAVSESNPYPDVSTATDYETVGINDVLPIWEAGEKLLHTSAANRNIYTFIGDIFDSDTALTPKPFGSSEVVAFNLSNLASIKPFLGVRCSDDLNCGYNYLGSGGNARAENLVNYIRGQDLEGLRPRTIRDENNVALGVWKLGDIVNSSPAAVSRPPNNYHLIYGDKSYQTFFLNNRNRETMVYVGANDGMLHAFTSWQYDLANRKYAKPPLTTEDIGEEIWAYIPQSLLPHLKWLADPDYSHVYYVDQMPLVADAKIGGAWKTLLIGGLRMGGKAIDVWGDFGSGDENKTFHPTYFCIDITEPRNPKLLWERAYEGMGFSYSVPTVVREGAGTLDNWYLVFGSGPTDYDGKSDQNGRLFVVDLATGEPAGLGADDWVFESGANAFFAAPVAMDKTLNPGGNRFTHDHVYIGQSYLDGGDWHGKIYRLDVNGVLPTSWAFNPIFSIDGPITAALALSVDKSNNTWIFGGTGRYVEPNDKITIDDQYLFGFKDPLYNPGRLSALVQLDKSDLYRVDNLVVTTNKDVLNRDDYTVAGDTPTWGDLIGKTDADLSDPMNPYYGDGWYRELPRAGERCITKPSVIGGLSLMPTFVPNDDICGFGGESYFYALYYRTGTAYFKSAFKSDGTYNESGHEIVLDHIFIGYGMPASHLGLHVGQQDGATALIQLGTGGIIKIDVETPLNIRSGILNWREN